MNILIQNRTDKYSRNGKNAAYLDVLQDDTTAPLVLIFHQFLSMFTFLLGGLLEELAESLQGNIVTVEVIGLKYKKESFIHVVI